MTIAFFSRNPVEETLAQRLSTDPIHDTQVEGRSATILPPTLRGG